MPSIRLAIPTALFGLFLSVPLLLELMHMDPTRSLEEYRRPATFPELSELTGGEVTMRAYTNRLAVWHSDNFPTRPFWVRLHTQWLFSLFGESDQVYVGDDGWMFYRNVLDNQLARLEQLSDAQIESSVDALARLSELLAAQGIELYVMPIPLKNSFYEEHLPREASYSKRFHRVDDLMDAIADEGGINFVDVRPVLSAAKDGGMPIFHQTDFHWTDPAAGLVGKALIERIISDTGLPYHLEQWTYDVVEKDGLSGGQARFLPLFSRPTETMEEIQNVRPDFPRSEVRDQGGVEYQVEVTADNAALLPPIVVYGDSFIDGMLRTGFERNFSALTRGRFYRDDIVDVYDARPEGTRFFLLEFIVVGTPDQAVDRLTKRLE